MPNVVHFEAVGPDGGALRDFYGKVFGWSFNVMPEMDYGTTDNGGRGIDGGIGSGPAASATFYVAVADPQATLDKAEKLGGKVTMPVMTIPDIVTLAQFTDPEGNLIGIVLDTPGQQMPPSSAPPAEDAVTWVDINGRDFKRLLDFYTGLFGWKLVQREGEGGQYATVDNGGEGPTIGVGSFGADPHAMWYVEVADPSAKMDEVTANGGKTEMAVQDFGGIVIGMFRDPAGNLIGLWHDAR